MASFYRFNGDFTATISSFIRKTDSNGLEYFASGDELDKSFLADYIREQIALQSESIVPVGDPPQTYYGLYGYKQSPTDLEPRETSITVPRETQPNPSFTKRKYAGEIVVSPMKVGELKITEYPYVVKESVVRYWNSQTKVSHLSSLPQVTLNGRTCSVLNGVYFAGSWTLYADLITDSKYEYMPFDSTYFENLMKFKGIDESLVTDTAAAINEVTLDLLTNLAELPETVKMVQDILSFSGNKLKAFRTAEKRLKKKLLKQGIPKNELESADALASLWLQFRYGIMPVYYTLQDIKEALNERFAVEYVKERKFKTEELKIKNFKGLATSTSSCWMKRRFDPSDSSTQFRRVFGVNPFTTAWELTTLSFVVDWFLNVGDVISALTPVPSLEEAATFSWKNEVKGTITNPDYPQGRIDIKLEYYEITPINYHDHVSLRFEPVLTAKRKLDALALSWSFSRSFLSKLK